MRAENRAGNSNPAEVRINKPLAVPRGLRTPIVGARLILAGLALGSAASIAQDAFKTFTGSGSFIAEAAGCKTDVYVMAFLYAQDPNKNPDNLTITNESYVIPIDIPNFGPAVVIWRKDPKDPKSPKREYKKNMDFKRDHAAALFHIDVDPNALGSSGRPALELGYRFDDDPIIDPRTGEKPSRQLILECGEPGYSVGGRVASSNIIDRVAKSTTITGLNKVGNRVSEIVAEVLRRKVRFTLPVGNPIDNLRLFKQQADEIKKSSDRIKEKERLAVQGTPVGTVTPTHTGTPTPTPTSTGTGTPTPTLTGTGTGTVTETNTSTATQTATLTPTPSEIPQEKPEARTKLDTKPEPKPQVKADQPKPDGLTPPQPPSTFDNVVSGAQKFAGDVAGRLVEGTGLPRSIREGGYYFEKIRNILNI